VSVTDDNAVEQQQFTFEKNLGRLNVEENPGKAKEFVRTPDGRAWYTRNGKICVFPDQYDDDLWNDMEPLPPGEYVNAIDGSKHWVM